LLGHFVDRMRSDALSDVDVALHNKTRGAEKKKKGPFELIPLPPQLPAVLLQSLPPPLAVGCSSCRRGALRDPADTRLASAGGAVQFTRNSPRGLRPLAKRSAAQFSTLPRQHRADRYGELMPLALVA
jgi:hypothetical protein